MIVFRAVQGIGAALIFPVSVSVLTNAFPAARASRAIGVAYGIAGLGNAAGPLVGGLLTQTLGWRWIFWLLVPFALVAFVIGALTVPESSDDTVPRRIDLTGLALITVGIGLFTLTFDRAPSWGWLAPGDDHRVRRRDRGVGDVRRRREEVRWPLVDMSLFRNARFQRSGCRGHRREYRVRRDDLPVDAESAAGARPRSADGGLAFLGPSIGAALGGPLSGRLAAKVSAGRRHGGWVRGLRRSRSRRWRCRAAGLLT